MRIVEQLNDLASKTELTDQEKVAELMTELVLNWAEVSMYIEHLESELATARSHKWVAVAECGELPGVDDEGNGGLYVVFNGLADKLHEREVSECEYETGVGWCLDIVSHVLFVGDSPVLAPGMGPIGEPT